MDNQPPQDFGEACEWFEKDQIDFDTLLAAVKTMPPPEELPTPQDDGERRYYSELRNAGLDTDCFEDLYAGDIIDFDQLCALWEAARANPQVEPPQDAPLGY